MPTKYQVPLKKFEPLFHDYIEIYKEVKFKPDSLKKIIDLIRGSSEQYDEKELINAKQVNAFFENLPIDIQWDNENSYKKNVEEVIKQREVEVQQIVAHEEKELEEKVKKIEAAASDAEKKLMANADYFRFLVKSSSITKGKRKTEINIRNIFMKNDDGDVQIYGSSKKEGEFVLSGSIDKDGNFSLEMRILNGDTFTTEGGMEVSETNLFIKLTNDIGNIVILLDLEYWFGFYEQGGNNTNMDSFIKIIGNNVVGYSSDELGEALWHGKMKGDVFNANKHYITQHEVKYAGKIKRGGAQIEIRGIWVIGQSHDNFYLSHNCGDADHEKPEEADEENNDEVDSELDKCTNGHQLFWSAQRGEYSPNFFCDNCGDKRKVESGRWNCAKDKFDVCGTCKKIPESETKKCPKGHQLEWNNKQGDYSRPAYICDPCRKEGKTSVGRWHCPICKYDLCQSCRKPG